MKGNYENSEKVFTPTIKDAMSYLDKINHAELIILHVGINDLKLKPIDVVSSDLEDLTKMGLEKARKVLLSLPLMCKNQELSYKVAGLVNMLFVKFSFTERLILIRNDNFANGGRIHENLFYDNIHLSNEGVSVLAGNFTHALGTFRRPNMNRPQGRQDNHDNIHNTFSGNGFPHGGNGFQYKPPRRQENRDNCYVGNQSFGYRQRPNCNNTYMRPPRQLPLNGRDNLASDLATAFLSILSHNRN